MNCNFNRLRSEKIISHMNIYSNILLCYTVHKETFAMKSELLEKITTYER